MPNIIQFENVVFTVGGQNPQAKTVQVAFSIDPVTGIGTGLASFTYIGTNSGVDTVTAALPSFGFTSNAATVAWQACPSLISASNVISVGVFHNGQSLGFNVSTPVPFDYTLTVQSLYYNTSKFFNIPGFGQDLGHQQPGLFQNITPQGTYAGPPETVLENASHSIQDGGNTVFKMVWQGSFVVAQPGNYNMQMSVDDSCIICIGNGATLVSGNIYNPYGQTTGPFTGYPVLMAANSSKSNNGVQSPSPESSIINFPTAGIYPFEIDYNNFLGPGGELDISFNGQTIIIPVTLLAVPAQPSPGNGNLLLTPTGGAANLLIQGQQVTLTLVLQNVRFQTQQFISVLEGNIGQVYIYNDPINPTFSFLPPGVTYYGSLPDGPSAVADDFTLVGDNTAWQGQISLRWDSVVSKFELFYNGSQALTNSQLLLPNVQLTTLTITQDDIAWFNNSNTSYDVFQATSAGGGKFAGIPVYYQLNPNYPAGSAVQVSPAAVNADGTPKTFTVTLARPLPPFQNNTAMNVAFSGAQPVLGSVSVTPNLVTIAGVANWLVSYTVTATWASAAVATTSTMQFSFIAPSITFLGGGYILTAAANAIGGNTAYAGTFSPVPLAGSSVVIAGFIAPANNGTFVVQAGSTGTSLIVNNAAGVTEVHAATATVLDVFTTKINYIYPLSVQPSALITLQAFNATNPVNVSLTELNGGTPVATAGISATTTVTATWVSANNNFSDTTFYITPNGGARQTLGVVHVGSAVITSIGGGRYQAVYTLAADTSGIFDSSTYQFSYLGTCTDSTSVSYTDTNFYNSNNPAPILPPGGGGGIGPNPGGGGGHIPLPIV
jgi:hypothetical protein